MNTTNLDFGDMRAWDLVAEARRALGMAGEPDRVRRILLASLAIPGAFPPREIDGGLYVDGALTGNILYGGRTTGEDSPAALWRRLHPGVPVPKTRYWILFNNQFRPPPEAVLPLDRGASGRVLTAYTGGADPLHDEVRARGWCLSLGERDPEAAAAAVAAPVFGRGRRFLGALGAIGPRSRFEAERHDRLAALVAEEAALLSRGIGG